MDRHDDSTINGEMILVRRIPHWGGHTTWDPETGEPTPSSQNFRDKYDELSTFILAETTVEAVLAENDGFGVVQFTAGKAREILGTEIIFCRDQTEPAPGHVLVCGNINGAMARRFRGIVTWVPGRWPVKLES